MLAPGDVALASRDREVPGLAVVLDPDAVGARLAEALPGMPPVDPRATYVRYKPRTSCVVGYRLRFPGGEVDASLKAHGRDAGAKVAKALARVPSPGPWGPGAVALGTEGVVASFLPNDRRLRGARCLADPQRRVSLLARLLQQQLCNGDRPITLHRLRYKPERRLVLRIDGPHGTIAVLKCYADAEFADAATGARAFGSRRNLAIADRLGGSSRHRVLALEWLDGDPLSTLTGPRLRVAAGPVGEALAGLHGQRRTGLRRPRPDAETRALVAAGRAVAEIVPVLATRAVRLAGRLAAALLPEPDVAGPIHGDFSADQVLLHADRVAIIDYDAAGIGDPVSDLALFRADLQRRAVAGRLEDRLAEAAARTLVDAYLEASGTLADADVRARLDLRTAAWLLRLAAEPFRLRQQDWPRQVADTLDRAERMVGG